MNDTRREYDANGQVADVPLTNDEQAALDASRAVAQAAQLKQQAKTLLVASDAVATRCIKAAIAYPAEWMTYDAALRTIVNSGAGTLPTTPTFPQSS